MDKPLLELYDFTGIGLIIEFPSGVRYANQTGGTSCHQKEMEGVFVPLTRPEFSQQDALDLFFAGSKWNGCCDQGIDEETADFLDAVFAGSFRTQGLEVDRTKLADSHEAWIHVIVSSGGQESEMWKGFKDAPGVVTWENSD